MSPNKTRLANRYTFKQTRERKKLDVTYGIQKKKFLQHFDLPSTFQELISPSQLETQLQVFSKGEIHQQNAFELSITPLTNLAISYLC